MHVSTRPAPPIVHLVVYRRYIRILRHSPEKEREENNPGQRGQGPDFKVMAAYQPHLGNSIKKLTNCADTPTFVVAGSSIDISELDHVLRLLTDCGFSKTNWHELGLRLGLLKSTLNEIEANYPKDVSRWLTECLDKWLRRADNVNSRGGATWNSLSDALKSINEVAVANKLNQESKLLQ